MEEIVAVDVQLESGDHRYFLTWGRVHHPTDPTALETLVLDQSRRFSLGGAPIKAGICLTLQEAATQPYFYECFFSMCQKRVPYGPRYRQWAEETRRAMNDGKELYFLGRPPSG